VFLHDTHVVVGPVHGVVDPVVEPQHELSAGYQPQQAGQQGQQVIPSKNISIKLYQQDLLSG